jgi:sec-independent protein translocase protein TatB
MLNVGMTELLCFAIIALLVLGPEKLPEAARFAAKWYGKAKRMISSIQNEIDQSLKLSEFRAEMQKEIEKITELEQRIQQKIDLLNQHSQTSEHAHLDHQTLEPKAAEQHTRHETLKLSIVAPQLSQYRYQWCATQHKSQLPFNPLFQLKHQSTPTLALHKLQSKLKIAV